MGEIYDVSDERFSRYGRMIKDLPVTELLTAAGGLERPDEGVSYVRSVAALEETSDFQYIQKWFGGGSRLQCGICLGHNVKMNAMEYHRSSEINIGAEDMILILGDLRDVADNQYDSALPELFFVPRGTAVELFGTTLHFAPCQTSEAGFSTVIILPEFTNESLSEEISEEIPDQSGERRLLFGTNKWLIAHPECDDVKNSFAYPGITRANVTVAD